jgi:CSLREA domain-containing protein
MYAAAVAGSCLLAATAQATVAATVPARPVAVGATVRFTVTTTADTHDARPGDGRCADSAGRCSLRAAVEEADASPARSNVLISVPAGRYLLTLGTLAAGAPAAPVRIVIEGAGPDRTVIGAGHAFRVMSVTAAATVVLHGLAITGGNAGPDAYGGGVLSSGALTVADALVAGNRAGAGGGLDNAGGSLVVSGSRIEDNHAQGFGGGGIQNGGLRNAPGSVLVVASTITGNVSVGNDGGGIFSGQNGHPASDGLAAVAPRRPCPAGPCPRRAPAPPGLILTVVGSEVSGNRGVEGGGISAFGRAVVAGSVIDGNSAGGADGGGVWGVGTIRNSTIAGNRADAGGGVSSFQLVPMTITTSTLDRNHAASYGGAINDGGRVTVIRSTLAGNTAGRSPAIGSGAAVEIQGSAELLMYDSTVAGNITTPAGGGAVDNFGGEALLSFDTFSGNSASLTGAFYTEVTGTILATAGSTENCQFPLHETAGYNLATDSSCGLSRPTDLTGVAPGLRALADNGGPTSTEALLRTSPAVDAGGLPATSGCPRIDQRGRSRPWGPACDIGAFERHWG